MGRHKGSFNKVAMTPQQKLAKKIGADGEEVLAELAAMDVADLNKRIAQANQAISDTKTELDQNEKYEEAKENVKAMSSGFREVKKRQNAIIAAAVQMRKDKGAV